MKYSEIKNLMSKYSRMIMLTLTLMSTISLNAQDELSGRVVYLDSINSATVRSHGIPAARTYTEDIEKDSIYSRLGSFLVTYDNNYFMTTGVLHCLYQAINAWESKITVEKPIRFHVRMSEDMDDNLSMKTDVLYRADNHTAIPDNLWLQSRYGDVAQDTITINAWIDWNSSWPYDDTYTGSVNLSLGFMRNIAHILGFGTSVIIRDNGLGYSILRTPSKFDLMLTDGTNHLNINDRNSNFTSFFSNQLYLHSDRFDYDVYSCGHYANSKSAAYFTLGHDNLMEYPVQNSDKVYSINRETLNVLEEIGWNVVPHDIEIKCPELNELGYGTVYQTMTFHAEDENGNTVNAIWNAQIYNPTTGAVIYSSPARMNNSCTFHTPAMYDSLDDFNCMTAQIKCIVNDKEYVFPISLETRPDIRDVRVSGFTAEPNGRYSFDIDIEAYGFGSGYVIVSDDTGSTQRYNYNGSTLHVGPFVQGYRIYIDIVMQNDYGEAGYFLSHEPFVQRSSQEGLNLITISANGIDNVRSLNDADDVTAKVSNPKIFEDADSVAWHLRTDALTCRKLYRKISTQEDCAFKIKPGMFNLFFAKAGKNHDSSYALPTSYEGKDVVFTDSCVLTCTIYTHDEKGKITYTLNSEPFTIDVLPEIPVITFSNIVFNEGWGDYTADVKVETYGYDFAEVNVYVNDVASYCDKIIEGNEVTEYTTYLGHGDLWYCWAYNKYGISKSKVTRIGYDTGIDTAVSPDCEIHIEGQALSVNCESDMDVQLYDAVGKVVDNQKCIKHYYSSLPSGLYILKVRILSGETLTRKIVVK